MNTALITYAYPLYQFYQVFKNATAQNPQSAPDRSDMRLNFIYSHLQKFSYSHSLRPDITLTTTSIISCMCVGSNRIKQTPAIIYIPTVLLQRAPEAVIPSINHEIKHLLSNDYITTYLVPAICSLAITILFDCIFPNTTKNKLLQIISAIAARQLSYVFFSRYREEKADEFAIVHSSNKELVAFKTLFMAYDRIQNRYSSTSYKLKESLELILKGNFLTAYEHPPTRDRIHKIEEELKRREIRFNDRVQREKMTHWVEGMIGH